MYLWKYWRDTRIIFSAAVLVIAALFIEILRERVGRVADAHQFANALPVFLLLHSLPLGFLGWFLGSFGIGRDLGEGSGSFLCSRPKNRSYFMWCSWACGLMQLLTIVALANMVLWFQIHRLLLSTGDASHGQISFPDGTSLSLISILCLTCAIVFLLVALVFTLTFSLTVVMKNVRGIIYGAGILVGYMILAARVTHYWHTVRLPNLAIQQFAYSKGQVAGIADHLGVSMAVRLAVILLFPFATQIVLEKMDI
jgi:hypothetical protein